MSSSKSEMIVSALNAMQMAYSPYSDKKIGACVELSNGKKYSGCNIENASFGGTVCAERVAIFKAVSENTAPHKIKSIVVASEFDEPWPPCGFCRQVIAEFATPETIVTLVNSKGYQKDFKFSELLPFAFGPSQMGKR